MILVLVLGVALGSDVAPGLRPPAETLGGDVASYFAGEKAQGYAWGAVGLLALGATAGLWLSADPTARGAAVPIGVLGVVQVVAAVPSLLRSDERAAAAEKAIASDGAAFVVKEQRRIATLNTLFWLLEAVEMALAVGGTALAVGARLRGLDTLSGVGMGLALQGVAMLSLDGLAHARAERYAEALRFSVRVAPDAKNAGASVLVGGRF